MSSLLKFDDDAVQLLCFGFIRFLMQQMDIQIKIDDLAKIVLNYIICVDVQPIFNTNYTRIELKHSRSNYNDNETSTQAISSRIICDFTFSPWITPSHNSSSVLFRPFLSTLFEMKPCTPNDNTLTQLQTLNRNRNRNCSINTDAISEEKTNVDSIYNEKKKNQSKQPRKIIFKLELKKKECNVVDGYKFQCGLIGIPKIDILGHYSAYLSNKNKGFSLTDVIYSDEAKETYLNTLQLFYSHKIKHFQNKSSLLSSLYLCSHAPVLNPNYYIRQNFHDKKMTESRYICDSKMNINIHCDDNHSVDDNDTDIDSKDSTPKHGFKYNELAMFDDYKFVGISCQKSKILMIDHADEIHRHSCAKNIYNQDSKHVCNYENFVYDGVKEDVQKWKSFAIGDYVQVCIERIDPNLKQIDDCVYCDALRNNVMYGYKHYYYDKNWIRKELEQGGEISMRGDYQLYFVKCDNDNINDDDGKMHTKQEKCRLKKHVHLDFDAFDYLFAFSSARCDCSNDVANNNGFTYEASFVRSYDQLAEY